MPAADRYADGARALGGKLKAARCGHGEPCDLRDHAAKPAMAQAFLETGEQHLLVAGLDENDAVGGQARLRESRSRRGPAG